MGEPSIVETERLDLRPLTMDDLDALALIYRDSEVRKYFPEGTLTYEQTREELEWIIDVYYAQHGFALWAATHKQTNEFIGRCGLLPWTIDGRSEVEVAYLLARAYWGRGLGTEAARAILAYGFRGAAPISLDLFDRSRQRGFHQRRAKDRDAPRARSRDRRGTDIGLFRRSPVNPRAFAFLGFLHPALMSPLDDAGWLCGNHSTRNGRSEHNDRRP
jgi:RimJ/RimL family protein N-acetyltransferase